jgi:hypothetical protein
MGQYFSTYDCDELENHHLKNYKYYSGERNFKVSRGFYPQFSKGYFWGRNEDMTYWFDLGWDDSTQSYKYLLERAF